MVMVPCVLGIGPHWDKLPLSPDCSPLPVEVLKLSFHDFNHDRPAPFATTWELHPAIVTLLR